MLKNDLGLGIVLYYLFLPTEQAKAKVSRNNQEGQRLMKTTKNGKRLLLKGPGKDAHNQLESSGGLHGSLRKLSP